MGLVWLLPGRNRLLIRGRVGILVAELAARSKVIGCGKVPFPILQQTSLLLRCKLLLSLFPVVSSPVERLPRITADFTAIYFDSRTIAISFNRKPSGHESDHGHCAQEEDATRHIGIFSRLSDDWQSNEG